MDSYVSTSSRWEGAWAPSEVPTEMTKSLYTSIYDCERKTRDGQVAK